MDQKKYPVFHIENIGNKLNADYFLHIAKKSAKPSSDIIGTIVEISNFGNPFTAVLIDLWTGMVFQVPGIYAHLTEGIEWEELVSKYGRDTIIAIYLFKKTQ